MRSPLAALPVFADVVLVAVVSCSSERPPVETLYPTDAGTNGVDSGPTVVLNVNQAQPDPKTCAEAADAHSYVGCDYWPTVLANVVWSYFDFAVVVSNVSDVAATVTVTGPSSTNRTLTINPGTIQKIVLPWVPNLKGADSSGYGSMTASVLEKGGAYHLVSSVPVVAYQFSALEYHRQYAGPAVPESADSCTEGTSECYSFTNDASLLLPSTAWTGSYRVSSIPGEEDANGSYIAIVASQAGTTVTTSLTLAGAILGGAGVAQTAGGGKLILTLGAGDVAELVTPIGSAYDLSGALVTADKPVEVFTGNPCRSIPSGKPACDHVEESVLPAESLGSEYIVTTPTKPAGGVGAHVVRFFGNRDGTTLRYYPKKPGACPDTLNAGQVVDCGSMIGNDFIVQGSAEFAISSFTASAQVYGTDPLGDPDQTSFASAQQFRTRYVFLAPVDYDINYAVIAGSKDAAPVIDGLALAGYREISSGYGVWRTELGRTTESHVLTSTLPVGLQVMGYGAYTSYTYPGGLSLALIAPPPSVK